MTLSKILYLSIYFILINSLPTELESFSEIVLIKGLSEYYYQYSNQFLSNIKTPFIYIKLSNYEKANIKVYLNKEEAYYYLTKKDEWINIQIKESKNINITIKVESKEKDLKMIFIDSSKILKINLIQLLNLNFFINKLVYKEPIPLLFNITVDTNILFSIQKKEENNYSIVDDDYILSYYNYEKDKDNKFKGAIDAFLVKGKTYIFKLNCYKDKNIYFFKKIKVDYFIEEVYIKNNTFIIHNFTLNNYIMLNIQEYSNIYFYIKDNSGFYHEYYKMTILQKDTFENFIKNNTYLESIKYNKITNGKLNKVENIEKEDYYLIIKLNYKNKKYKGFISFFSEMHIIKDENFFKEIKKGTQALIYTNKNPFANGILSSSNNNVKFLYELNSKFNTRIFLNNEKENYIYINSSEKNTKIFCTFLNYTKNDNNKYNYHFLRDGDINKIINKSNDYSLFFRKSSNKMEPGYYSYYFFDIQEQYYIYTKKYFGKINIFKYKNNLDLNASVQNFMKPISYYDENLYEIVNNKLLILSGSQFFNYYINSGSFFYFFIQKVNDIDYFDIIKEKNKYNNNTIKILNKNKIYKIKFELNHLIKLDNNFLYAEIIFNNKEGKKYILNNKNKILYLKGNNYTVESNKIALIYFYEKIPNYNNKSLIEFDKLQTGKNMNINITNKGNFPIDIYIAKDFGFKYFYPLINIEELEIYTIPSKKTINLYIDNYYDLLETDIYESDGEKYFIYLFEIKNNKLIFIDNTNIEISSPLYFNSITKFSKYNFEYIAKGNNSLILKSSSSKYNIINYQFIKCSNNDIKFNLKIIDNNIIKNENNIIGTNTLLKNDLDKNKTLIYSFESKEDFLFLYDLSNKTTNILRKENYGIKYLNINNKNILSIAFTPFYTTFSEFIIIIAKKDKINNLYSFSNPCYLTKLIMNNSKDICYKKVYHGNEQFIMEEIDINKIIQNKKDEIIINIISINLILLKHLDIYIPVIYNEEIKNNNAIQLKLFDNIIFKPEKDYFIYEHLTEEKNILYIDVFKDDEKDLLLILTENNENIKIYKDINSLNSFEINLEKKGKYFLEFYLKEENKEQYFPLRIYSLNKMLEEIDLNKNIYQGLFYSSIIGRYEMKDLPYYKVTNLKEDKKVYFIYGIDVYFYPMISYKKNLINICENEYDKCISDINSYTFLKGKNYTIYINLSNSYYRMEYSYANTYSFFPESENTFQNISQAGYYSIDSPKIFIFDNKEDYFIETYNILPYYLLPEDFDNKNNFLQISAHISNEVLISYFNLEKDSDYRTIIFIPENNDKLKQIFVSNKNLDYNEEKEIQIKEGNNYLINLNYRYSYSLENYFITYTSPIENIKYINLGKKINNNKKFIIGIWEKYLYIDKTDTDIIIKKENYEPKFLLFSILNDETIDNYISFLESKKIYINRRINTDQILINDLVNFYIDKFDVKYNLYIKKYYGEIKLYESEYELNNIENNITILTKPINNLRNKTSIFNRLIQLDKNKIITGYLSTNSFIDIYLEKDDNNKDIYISEFKNRKYLKKGIEYHFHFYLNHLIKLEPQFNSEIIIYNEDTIIILNNTNQTGIIIGNNYKIKATENAMVYFYPKTKKFQKRINPLKDQIIEIKIKGNFINRYFYIDFGFEGFEPPNMNYYDENILYIENIYDKLETELTQGEYLYIYYDSLKEDDIEINYINNAIINTAYKYNFIPIKKNMKEKKLIFSNINQKIFKLLINQLNTKPPYKLKINDRDSISEFSEKNIKKYYHWNENRYETFQFTFESESDLLLSYFFYDITHDYFFYKSNNKWVKEIKEYNNLTINNISLINGTKIKINFNANYLNALTKYIIMITPEEKNNTFKNMKNVLYLTELINQKNGNFIIEEYYDIGENHFIEVIIDISQLINNYNKFIINIISQELRIVKELNFYEPKLFILENNIFAIIKKGLFVIIAVALFIGLIWIYYKKQNKNINLKKQKLERFDKDFGVELNDDKEFINSEN